jgi:hypothetical protein
VNLVFLTPLHAVVAIVASVPVVAAVVRERRARRTRSAVGLATPRFRSNLPTALAVLVVCLLAVAAAQPETRAAAAVTGRIDAEAYVVLDVSRSMLASSVHGAPTRFARAITAAERLSGNLPGVPVGVASFTDRVVASLLPTQDRAVENDVLERALTILQPPPSRPEAAISTDLGSLGDVPTLGLFPPGVARRLVILFSDGESQTFDPRLTALILNHYGVGLVVVRLWSRSDRIYAANGRVDPGYAPDPTSTAPLLELARLTAGGRVYTDREVPQAAAAARRFFGSGPRVVVGRRTTTRPLGRLVILAAAIPLGLLIAWRNL